MDFDKRHSDVTEIIRKLTTENSAVKNMMIESFGHRANEYTEYLIIRGWLNFEQWEFRYYALQYL